MEEGGLSPEIEAQPDIEFEQEDTIQARESTIHAA